MSYMQKRHQHWGAKPEAEDNPAGFFYSPKRKDFLYELKSLACVCFKIPFEKCPMLLTFILIPAVRR